MTESEKINQSAEKVITALNKWQQHFLSHQGKILDSSINFQLKDGTEHHVDAGWVNKADWLVFQENKGTGSAILCPDFVVKFFISSQSSLSDLKSEMTDFKENGCPLGWLIEPEKEEVFIFKPEEQIHQIPTFDYYLDGRDILRGFEFPLKRLRY